MLTQSALMWNAFNSVHAHDLRQGDHVLTALPMFHVFANTCILNRSVIAGGEIVMLPRFNAKQAIAAIRRTRTRAVPGVPTMFQALLDCPDMSAEAFSSVKYSISGGAPLPETLQASFDALTGNKLIEGYGLSETSGVVSTNPYVGLKKPAITRIVVVLPAPFGPRNPSTSPGSTLKLNPSTARNEPYCLVSP